MTFDLPTAIRVIGFAQLSVLIASALVPLRLNWKSELSNLPPLMRQLFWIYGGYIVLSITSLGLLCIFFSDTLANGSPLSRAICAYAATFWGIRLALQPFLHAESHLMTSWLRMGYRTLTALFGTFTAILSFAVLR